jgi:hypothetical protein
MFRGKINRSNSRLLLTILERLRSGEREVLTVNTLFNSEVVLNESCFIPDKILVECDMTNDSIKLNSV